MYDREKRSRRREHVVAARVRAAQNPVVDRERLVGEAGAASTRTPRDAASGRRAHRCAAARRPRRGEIERALAVAAAPRLPVAEGRAQEVAPTPSRARSRAARAPTRRSRRAPAPTSAALISSVARSTRRGRRRRRARTSRPRRNASIASSWRLRAQQRPAELDRDRARRRGSRSARTPPEVLDRLVVRAGARASPRARSTSPSCSGAGGSRARGAERHGDVARAALQRPLRRLEQRLDDERVAVRDRLLEVHCDLLRLGAGVGEDLRAHGGARRSVRGRHVVVHRGAHDRVGERRAASRSPAGRRGPASSRRDSPARARCPRAQPRGGARRGRRGRPRARERARRLRREAREPERDGARRPAPGRSRRPARRSRRPARGPRCGSCRAAPSTKAGCRRSRASTASTKFSSGRGRSARGRCAPTELGAQRARAHDARRRVAEISFEQRFDRACSGGRVRDDDEQRQALEAALRDG